MSAQGTTMSATQKKARLFGMLQRAVTLELSTLPPYLMAMWSLRPGSNVQAAAIIRSVLMEEMLHMTLAANLLSAVGGQARLDAEHIPRYPLELEFRGPPPHDRGIHIQLAGFSPATIDAFMQIELPQSLLGPSNAAPAPELVLPGATIGQFYADIAGELRALQDELGAAVLFSGDVRRQVSLEYYWKGGGHPVVVTGLDTALLAVRVISEQGEGAGDSLSDGDSGIFGQPDEVGHYFRFKQIQARRLYAAGDSIHGEPSGAALPVDFDAVYPVKPNCRQVDYAADPQLAAMSAKFNAGYTMMLSQLAEGFAGNPAVFYTAIMNGMQGLGEVARAMVRLPIRGDAEGRHAAPTFEWNPAGCGL